MKILQKTAVSVALMLVSTSLLYAQADNTSTSTTKKQTTFNPQKKSKTKAQHYVNEFLGGQTTVMVVGGSPNDELVKVQATDYFRRTLRPGSQQVGMPSFIIADKNNRASFALGGFVKFRTAYDFNNNVNNLDFVTYNIPMHRTPQNEQRFLMDASTSRIYFKTVINTNSVGPIEAYIETDFRGSGTNLRLREAYVSVGGFLAGQTTTTFCDLAASPNTIDFQGPNGYTYNRNLMVRFSKTFTPHWSMAIAAEFPSLQATTGPDAEAIPQRVPDIPAYVQYAWNKGLSHVRLSAVMRNLSYFDKIKDKTSNSIGYGVSLSGVIKACSFISFTGQALYGQGLTPYVADLNTSSLDLVPDPENPGKLITPPLMSWVASTKMNFTKKLAFTVGYSQVHVWNRNGFFSANEYKLSQYIVSNMFYKFNPAIQVGVEYLYGNRTNQDNAFEKAHRVQGMVQVNF